MSLVEWSAQRNNGTLLGATASTLKLGGDQGGVVSSESEGIADHGIDLHGPGFMRDIVEVAFRVGVFQVDGWGSDLLLDGLGGEGFGPDAWE